jgi:hypothetical protein
MTPVEPRQWAEIRVFAESLAGEKARQIIGKAGLRRSDLEDVRQQLLLYVVSHLPRYDPRRGTPEAHVTMLIKTAVALLLRGRRLHKHGRGKPTASLDAGADGQRAFSDLSRADHGRRLGRHPHDETDLIESRLDFAEAAGSLPTDLQILASLLLQGQTTSSVARLTDQSRRRVRARVEAIRAHLKRYGLHEW